MQQFWGSVGVADPSPHDCFCFGLKARMSALVVRSRFRKLRFVVVSGSYFLMGSRTRAQVDLVFESCFMPFCLDRVKFGKAASFDIAKIGVSKVSLQFSPEFFALKFVYDEVVPA